MVLVEITTESQGEHTSLGGTKDPTLQSFHRNVSLRLPQDLEDVSMVPKLVAELLRREWTEEEVSLALGKNLIRVLSEAEAVRRRHTRITTSS